MNALLHRAQDTDSGSQWSDEDETAEQGEEAGLVPEEIDHEAEYIDEEKYTTVVVENMDLSREGLDRLGGEADDVSGGIDEAPSGEPGSPAEKNPGRRMWSKQKPKGERVAPKKKKKKFRYESKTERKISRMKEKSKNSREAKARRAT